MDKEIILNHLIPTENNQDINNIENLIMPIGQYKGEPIVNIINKDKIYCDYMAKQPWFREKHPIIYQAFINNFGEPKETPEHNAIQARFLDDCFCLAIFKLLAWIPLESILYKKFESIKNTLNTLDYNSKYRANQEIKSFTNYFDAQKSQKNYFSILKKFEIGGWDVALRLLPITYQKVHDTFEIDKIFDRLRVAIEIKTTLGDDYPATLRQIKRHENIGIRCLVYNNCTSIGASIKQIKDIFFHSNIKIFSIADIDEILSLNENRH